MASEKLGAFLGEVSDWDWEQFVRAEKDKHYTSNQAIIFALIRACAMQKLPAIKVALSRLDGKLKTPVKIEYPKFFITYPHASMTAADAIEVEKDEPILLAEVDNVVVDEEIVVDKPIVESMDANPRHADVPSMSLRETLAALSEESRELPEVIIKLAEAAHAWVDGRGEKPPEIPKVKSVVASHLLIMAQSRNIDAMSEVFDQIDGKLVETIQILGEDVYVADFSPVAPEGAIKNAEGIYQIEAKEMQKQWTKKLSEGQS